MVIMGVDDSSTMRKIIGLAVKDLASTFLEAENGQDALGKLAGGPKPDLFLVDVNMPVMGGIDLVKALRAQPAHAKTPIIIITTETDQALKDQGLKAGANSWILKPFEKDQLLAVINGCRG